MIRIIIVLYDNILLTFITKNGLYKICMANGVIDLYTCVEKYLIKLKM